MLQPDAFCKHMQQNATAAPDHAGGAYSARQTPWLVLTGPQRQGGREREGVGRGGEQKGGEGQKGKGEGWGEEESWNRAADWLRPALYVSRYDLKVIGRSVWYE